MTTIRTQQLFKSHQRKIDDLPMVRLMLARCLRDQRMGFKAAGVMLDAVARNASGKNYVEESMAELDKKIAGIETRGNAMTQADLDKIRGKE